MKNTLSFFLVFAVFYCLSTIAGTTTMAQNGTCNPNPNTDPPMIAQIEPAADYKSVCSTGIDNAEHIQTSLPISSLPDIDYIIEVNDSIVHINKDASFDATQYNVDDQICVTAFAYDLDSMNNLLTTAGQLCPLIDCDWSLDIEGINQGVIDLIEGNNDGEPGLNNLQDAIMMAGLLGSVASVDSTVITFNDLNVLIGGLLGYTCFATSNKYCVSIINCDNACSDPTACNYNPNCTSPCEGSCIAATQWFQDLDGDGLGNPNEMLLECYQPNDYVANADDADDCNIDECGICNGIGIAPGTCDCDGTAQTTWYFDDNGDGIGDLEMDSLACEQPENYSAIGYITALEDLETMNLNELTLNPNPVQDFTQLQFASTINQKMLIKIIDLTGRVVLTNTIQVYTGDNTFNINASVFASGTYLLSIGSLDDSNNQHTLKFVVE